MLNFLLRLDVSVIPKTTKVERLKENIESVDFEMELEDFKKIKLMDLN